MTTFTIYLLLLIATTLYAIVLAQLPQLEPDLTWLEVVIGVCLCLAAPYVDRITNGPLTSEVYEQRVWLAFLIGGFPIIVWQIGKNVSERLQAERGIRGTHGNATRHAPNRAPALADEPGGAS